MRKYTVDEKLEYNKKKKTPFSYGYRFGVMAYRSYATASEKKKADIRYDINFSSKRAKEGKPYDKGFMSGVRDAANERKHK